MHDVLGLVLGGGRGTRLWPLTKLRSEPAVPVGGKYRLIDIPLSNCINSGVRRVFVLTQFQSVSLHRHIANTYKMGPFSGGYVEVLAAQQTNEAADWYQGTADAVRQNLRYLQETGVRDVLVLYGDQLYRMDYGELVRGHREAGADVTLAVVPVEAHEARDVGILRPDEGFRVRDLVEKPQRPEQLEALRPPAGWLARHGLGKDGRDWLANMGIYVFRLNSLDQMLAEQPEAIDLVTELCGHSLGRRHVRLHLFDGYWKDLGAIGSYHAANLALAADPPPFDFFAPEGPIYTHMRNLPASRVEGAMLQDCLVTDGCVIEAGSELRRSVIGIRTRICRGAVLHDAVVNGAERLETDAERAANRRRGLPDLGVGEGSVIEGAILDKGCRIGRNVRIHARRAAPDEDGPYHHVRDGIVVVPRATVIPDGTVI